MRKQVFIGLVTLFFTVPAYQAHAEPASLTMSDFAFGAELTPAGSELRSFVLTPLMIKDIRRGDLGDIRVCDGNNTLMPALVRKIDGEISTSQQRLSITPVRTSGKITAYILDRTAKHERSLKSLQLNWNRSSTPKILSMRVEHSPDKKHWQTLSESETVVNFDFKGIFLKQNEIDINSNTDRYIRLTFLDAKLKTSLASVYANTSNRPAADYWWIHAGKLQSDENNPNVYRFSLKKGIKPDMFKLLFPGLNSIIAGSLNRQESVNGKTRSSTVQKDFTAFAVSLNNKVPHSLPVDISQWPASDWLIKVNKTVNVQEDNLPAVLAAYPRYEVVFASDGEEPYTAVWGYADAGAPMPGNIAARIETGTGGHTEITEVNPGITLNNAGLTEIMESRQSKWMLVTAGILILSIAAIVFLVIKPSRCR